MPSKLWIRKQKKRATRPQWQSSMDQASRSPESLPFTDSVSQTFDHPDPSFNSNSLFSNLRSSFQSTTLNSSSSLQSISDHSLPSDPPCGLCEPDLFPSLPLNNSNPTPSQSNASEPTDRLTPIQAVDTSAQTQQSLSTVFATPRECLIESSSGTGIRPDDPLSCITSEVLASHNSNDSLPISFTRQSSRNRRIPVRFRSPSPSYPSLPSRTVRRRFQSSSPSLPELDGLSGHFFTVFQLSMSFFGDT